MTLKLNTFITVISSITQNMKVVTDKLHVAICVVLGYYVDIVIGYI